MPASGEDEHPGCDQLMADMRGRPGMPRTCLNAGGLGQDVVAVVGDLAELFDCFIEVAELGGVPPGGAVKSAVEKLIRGWTYSRVSN